MARARDMHGMLLQWIVLVLLCAAVEVRAQDADREVSVRRTFNADCEYSPEEGEYFVKWYAVSWKFSCFGVPDTESLMMGARAHGSYGCMVMFERFGDGAVLPDLWSDTTDSAECKYSNHDYRLALLIPRRDDRHVDTIAFTRGGCMLLGREHRRVRVSLLQRMILVLPYVVSLSLQEYLTERYGITKFYPSK